MELIPSEIVTDGEALGRRLSTSAATIMQATPVTWRHLVEANWRGAQDFRPLRRRRFCLKDLADALLERVDQLWNLYGPTETTIWSTAWHAEKGFESVSIGRPIANTRIYIVGPGGQPYAARNAWRDMDIAGAGRACADAVTIAGLNSDGRSIWPRSLCSKRQPARL